MASAPEAVAYAAKSTADEHGSIPTQLADCRALAEREGLKVVETYQDESASAYSGDRGQGLAEALAHAERIKGVLIVQHTDRLARGDAVNARHLIEIYLQALKAGFKLRSVQDDSTCDNLVMAAVMGERNTEDSRRKSLAVQAGKRRAWERGELSGAPTPDGYERLSKTELRQDPDRQEIIRLMGELADQGWGDPSIARELNRRGHRTKGGGAWTRRRIQDLLSNQIYYGGIPWRRGKPDEEVNWETSFPSYWSQQDLERRRRGYEHRDLAKGSDRSPGHPNVNHALAGLATCGGCREKMRPVTSTYRRKDGSRKRTYNCRHVQDGTGLCHEPPVDAELIDNHVVNELQRYLGDFEAWRDQLTSGYASERQRLEREVSNALGSCEEQELACERADRLGSVATTDSEAKAALRIAAKAHEELERRRRRLDATQHALDEVPSEAPADAMLDFYNALGEAVRGRLEAAHTLARVNDALRDIFSGFTLISPPHDLGEGILVVPTLRRDRTETRSPELAWITGPDSWREFRGDPPLRTLHAPSPQLANAQL
jgi:site-specific DNA recombinase